MLHKTLAEYKYVFVDLQTNASGMTNIYLMTIVFDCRNFLRRSAALLAEKDEKFSFGLLRQLSSPLALSDISIYFTFLVCLLKNPIVKQWHVL